MGTSTTPTSEATSSTVATEAHASPQKAHDLREEDALVTASTPKTVTAAHTSDWFALGLYSELASPKKRLIQVLCLHGALFVCEFDVGLPVTGKESRFELTCGVKRSDKAYFHSP